MFITLKTDNCQLWSHYKKNDLRISAAEDSSEISEINTFKPEKLLFSYY